MSKSGRQEQILAIVQAAGRARVVDLSEQLAVSEMTVRRDLEDMEAQGLLLRVHGGAISTRSRSFEPGFAVRNRANVQAKQRIGQAAAGLIRDGETVILDAGTTTLHVAQALAPDIRLRAMALSLQIADVLVDMPNVSLVLPGGTVRPRERSLVGAMAVETLDRLRFDTVVLTAGGVDVIEGVTEYDFDDSATKQAALRSARRTIVVADATKVGAVAFARLCPIDAVDVLVTDRDARPAQVEAFREAGVEVILA